MMNFEKQKESLIKHLIEARALKNPKIIEAFNKIPRHLFVRKEYLSYAYEDIPLPTFSGQTISQPYTIAIMTETLDPKSGEKILEIGSGSGYQAALIGFCIGKKGKIITIELEKDLVKFSKKNLKKTKLKNVEIINGDGKGGYSKEAPYDKCIITAACEEVPKAVKNQVKIGGRIVAPVNDLFGQKMMVIDKIGENKFNEKNLVSFVFVPLR